MASTSSFWNAVQKRLSLAEKVWSEETGTFDGESAVWPLEAEQSKNATTAR